MKSFAEAYKDSKKEVLAQREALLESQKTQVIEVMKSVYLIPGKISELPKKRKEELAKSLLEYWNPKTGITKAGYALINESKITLSVNSTERDIRRYVEIEVNKNYDSILESFRNRTSKVLVESFKEDIFNKTGRKITESSLLDLIWNQVSNDLKNS